MPEPPNFDKDYQKPDREGLDWKMCHSQVFHDGHVWYASAADGGLWCPGLKQGASYGSARLGGGGGINTSGATGHGYSTTVARGGGGGGSGGSAMIPKEPPLKPSRVEVDRVKREIYDIPILEAARRLGIMMPREFRVNMLPRDSDGTGIKVVVSSVEREEQDG